MRKEFCNGGCNVVTEILELITVVEREKPMQSGCSCISSVSGSCLPAALITTCASVFSGCPRTARGHRADRDERSRHRGNLHVIFYMPCLQGCHLFWLPRREEGSIVLAAACMVSLQLKNRCQVREDEGQVPWGSSGLCPQAGALHNERGWNLLSAGHDAIVFILSGAEILLPYP